MASYTNILNHLSEAEGGLVYISKERQWTNKGIQETTFYKLAPSLLGIKNPTLNDLKKLTYNQWTKFVKYFWDKATYNNSINNQDSANLVFTAYFMSGNEGIKDIQKVFNLPETGSVGELTVKKINSDINAPKKIYIALDNRFRRLAANNPERYGDYLSGWLNRIKKLYNHKPNYILPIGILAVITGIYLYYE